VLDVKIAIHLVKPAKTQAQNVSHAHMIKYLKTISVKAKVNQVSANHHNIKLVLIVKIAIHLV